ncbi:MAG: mevalonate kinase [Candidatus Diapherotrites archaeon]|nr:mevalonate kinase [Candidatus Diapherotrites archaeon]
MHAVNAGYAKAILFGEHFVVFGLPGIVAGLPLHATARIKKNNQGIFLHCPWHQQPLNVLKNRSASVSKIGRMILAQLRIPFTKRFLIEVRTTIPSNGGLGSSAALSVAITRALSHHFKKNLSDNEINSIAFKCEKIFHQTPSGIDNTAATYGGLFWFQKKKPKNQTKFLHPSKPLPCILVNSGIHGSTKKAVARVRRRKQKNPALFRRLFKEYRRLASDALRALQNGDLSLLGTLMNQNQELLQQIGVSNSTLNKITLSALHEGALGAKITGAGLGGNVLVLASNFREQKKIQHALQRLGYACIPATLH